MEYKTIVAKAEASFVVKKSEFIGYIAPVETDEAAVAFVGEIRSLHRKATHNCYAYILRESNIARHSDDGEPGGTAGVPIHEVLQKAGLVDVACVVTRYFGGIMLGAGGLVRAYSHGAAIAVDAAKIKLMAMARRLSITIDYSLYGKIGALLADPLYDIRIDDEVFSDNVEVVLWIRSPLTEPFTAALVDLCNGRVQVNALNGEPQFFDFGK